MNIKFCIRKNIQKTRNYCLPEKKNSLMLWYFLEAFSGPDTARCLAMLYYLHIDLLKNFFPKSKYGSISVLTSLTATDQSEDWSYLLFCTELSSEKPGCK